jgi:hypothetical protein
MAVDGVGQDTLVSPEQQPDVSAGGWSVEGQSVDGWSVEGQAVDGRSADGWEPGGATASGGAT